jgi:hypothetical protein
MDLQALLKKTESRSTKIKGTRAAPSVATEERPYTNDLAPPAPAQQSLAAAKSRTNREQIENRTENKPGTNREQTGSETENNAPSSPVAPDQTGNKLGAQPGTELRTNREQIENKSGTEPRFLALSGLQRGTVLFMYSLCRAAGTRATENVRLDAIASNLETTPGAIKETIKRLVAKGFIQRVDFRAGRGGFSSYALPEGIYRQLFELESGNKLGTNREQTGNKLGAQPGTQLGTSPSSSSSVLDSKSLKTTTTEAEFTDKKDQQYSAWNSVDPSPLAEFGFTQSHVIQLARDGKLSVEEVQDSIHFFAFDLKRNGKGKEIKGPPVSFFMGILRKGVPYAPPSNFENPEEAARRLYVESKRRLKERRESQVQEIKELEFSEWRNELTREAINGIVPEVSRSFPKLSESALKAHFDENVWPERRAAVPGLVAAEQADIRHQIEQSLEQGSTS